MQIRIRAAVGLIGVFGGMASADAQAQAFQCAALKPSSSLAPGYASVPGQARCEGFFEKTVSQPFIELLSLTRGAPPSAAAAPAASAASAPLAIRTDVRAPARLVVQPLPSRPFYRVDAALAPGQALSWDAAPMLAATRQPVSGLGFLALVTPTSANPGALPALAPVAFTPQAPQDGPVYAVVRVSVDVASVAWRSYRVGNDAAASPPPTWTDLPDSNLYAWKHITLTIPIPADGKGLRVDVQAVGAANAQSLPLLRFAIVGPNDEP